MSEYKIPDSKTEPLKCLVISYKMLMGAEYDDRAWDSIHFSRAGKSAKVLLEICGSLRVADSCMVEVAQKFEEAGLPWTLETIVRHAHEWVNKKRGGLGADVNARRARFFKAAAERRGSGDLIPVDQVSETLPDSIRGLFDFEKRNKENGGTD